MKKFQFLGVLTPATLVAALVCLAGCGTPLQEWSRDLFHPGGDDDPGPALSVFYGDYTDGSITTVSGGTSTTATLTADTLTINSTPSLVEAITLAFVAEYDTPDYPGYAEGVVTISKAGVVIGYIGYMVIYYYGEVYYNRALCLGPYAETDRSTLNSVITTYGGTAIPAITYTDANGYAYCNDLDLY
jgi:hypothetical protein